MAADLSMTFNNLIPLIPHPTVFAGKHDGWLSPVASYAQLPDTSMPRGTQVMAVNTSFFAGAGASWFWCCWYDPISNTRFGVRIDAGMQPFGAGNRPTWQVMFDHNNLDVDPVWSPSGDDPASKYHWPKSIGWDIEADATSAHEQLSIMIQIQPL
ncbi:hypothetical protein [Ferruginibacter sp.]|nr:hypothetical protein [Ferruginibacter sp.]